MILKSIIVQALFLYFVNAYGLEKSNAPDPDEKLNTTVIKKINKSKVFLDFSCFKFLS